MSHQSQMIAGRYELQALAGEGGMAKVWRAVVHGAAGFHRVVAIKEIKAEFGAVQSYIDMFVEEARVGSDLAHPNIVQVYDFITERGSYYLVMEWVEGLDLERFLQVMSRDRRPVPWDLAAAVGIEVLHALGAAHERRRPGGIPAPIIHRDVSPPNILLGVNGTVKLTDFGLARARDRIYSLTAPGTVKGKLSYLSPEVTYGMPATPMADLFSVGVVLWESLAARRLFPGPGDLEIFHQIRRCYVPSLGKLRPDVPERMVALVHRALTPEPDGRFSSARDMAAELVEVLRATDAFSDLQGFLSEAVTDAYRRHRRRRDGAAAHGSSHETAGVRSGEAAGEGSGAAEASQDEPTQPRIPLADTIEPASRPPVAGPSLFGGRNLEVEFSDSEVTTLPDVSSSKRAPQRATPVAEDGDVRRGEDALHTGGDDVTGGRDP